MVTFDEFGPEKIIEVYDAKIGMRGFLVIDNIALGPGLGGIRMTPTVDRDEVARLARTMTWKNAMAGLPFGGAKAGIIAEDKQISEKKKKAFIEAFAREVKTESPTNYIAGEDMNTGPIEMSWYAKSNGSTKSVTGKPISLGGVPGEVGITGFGVAHAAEIAASTRGIKLKGATFAVEGFGKVGISAAKYLTEMGAKLIAISDSKGCAHNLNGMDFNELLKVKKETGSVTNYKPSKTKACHDLIGVPADILVTAAIPDFIKAGDVDNIKAKIIVEGSNIPMAHDVEELLHKKGILVVPDFVANAGGVISSHVELTGGGQKKMFSLVKKKIDANTKKVLQTAQKEKISPRTAALEIAMQRVRKKCKVCKI